MASVRRRDRTFPPARTVVPKLKTAEWSDLGTGAVAANWSRAQITRPRAVTAQVGVPGARAEQDGGAFAEWGLVVAPMQGLAVQDHRKFHEVAVVSAVVPVQEGKGDGGTVRAVEGFRPAEPGRADVTISLLF